MKVYYHSALNNIELLSDSIYRAIPFKAFLKLHKDKSESPYELLLNGTIIDSDIKSIDLYEEAELVVRQNGARYVYSVRPAIQSLSTQYARAYEQFGFEYRNKKSDEINSIQNGKLRLYAIDQSTEVHDYTEVFDQIEMALRAFKTICEKPKSHLKAVNEVRPIETVKRVGYESIPYLASHSEDWLARTAGGLKPARLFSRVEDDEYQIYENRVVKTLIDLILSFLRKTEKKLRDQREQLRGIINSSVQTGSFGFDINFQKAVSELMSSDDKGEAYRSKSLELVEKLQARAYTLLKHYRALRQTRLYRYLKKTKAVSNPINETNILVMDKHYSVVFKLWKTLHHIIAPKTVVEEKEISFSSTHENFTQFCATLCGYSAHILGFKISGDGCYIRYEDNIEMGISHTDMGLIRVTLRDIEPRSVKVDPVIDVPVADGDCMHRITFEKGYLSWPNDITDDEIDAFCSIFKTKGSRGKEQNEERRKFIALKRLLDQEQRRYAKPKKTSFNIAPIAIELSSENRMAFKTKIDSLAQKLMLETPNEKFVVALPICDESEQKIIEYAKEDGRIVAILPLTMFDINSFRRVQNVLYREILKLKKNSCPNCGGKMKIHQNLRACDHCNKLTITDTRCANTECQHEYSYMGYDVSEATLQKMQKVQRDNFFEWDSLYQYKDIVDFIVDTDKIRVVCPRCHNS